MAPRYMAQASSLGNKNIIEVATIFLNINVSLKD
jgi:hypothetical protein